MDQLRPAALLLALVLGAIGCGSSPEVASPSDLPTIRTETPPGGERKAGMIVYVTPQAAFAEEPGSVDVWLYDVAKDSVRRLTDDGDERIEGSPKFRDATRVTFFAGPYENEELFEIDLRTGNERKVLSPSEGILAYDWKPGGRLLAYLTSRELRTYDSQSGTTSVVKPISPVGGRGVGWDDEFSVEWADTGPYMLVVKTDQYEQRPPPIHMLTRDGIEFFHPNIRGTLARWSPTQPDVYFRDFESSEDRWHVVSISGDGRPPDVQDLDIRSGTVYPAVSPGGRYIATSGGDASAQVHVHDVSGLRPSG